MCTSLLTAGTKDLSWVLKLFLFVAALGEIVIWCCFCVPETHSRSGEEEKKNKKWSESLKKKNSGRKKMILITFGLVDELKVSHVYFYFFFFLYIVISFLGDLMQT